MLFEVKNINKSFKGVPVIEDFSLEVEEGDMIALVGKRKHGKTTLMQMLSGILSVDSGQIYYRDKLVSCKGKTSGLCRLRRSKIGYMNTEAILLPDMTVYENLFLAMSHTGGGQKQKKQRAKTVLRNLGLKGKGRFYPKELSTLDRQKVCVARAIINDPELLICDEPTDILEGYGAEQLMDILEILNSAGITIILSTHSKRIATRCRKVYAVHEGLELAGLGNVTIPEPENETDGTEKAIEENLQEPGEETYTGEKNTEINEQNSEAVNNTSEEAATGAEPDLRMPEASAEGTGETVSSGEPAQKTEEDEEDLPEIDLSDIFG